MIIPVKMRRGNECNDKILCITCNFEVTEIKEFEANINISKRQAPNQVGHMLLFYKE